MAGGGSAPAEPRGSKKNVFGEESAPDVSLNLTALMDILSNLLFFLLASFGATIVMAINVAVPVQSADKSDVADTGQSVTVNVKLAKDSIEVAATGMAQTEAELAALHATLAYAPDKLDFTTLTTYLLDVKQKYPRSDTIILTPEPGVPYQAMIGVMDAARENEVKAGGKIRMVRLFPTVVVSTLVK